MAAIEAAYLTKFAPFIEWPATVAREPSTLCVLHADRIENLIQHTGSVVPDAIDQTGEHASVRVVGTIAEAGSCHVLFAGTPEVEEDAEILKALSAAPVLTVTSEAEPGRKGVINFVIRDDRVRFEIDEAAAARHGLNVSSKLLSLAVPAPPKS